MLRLYAMAQFMVTVDKNRRIVYMTEGQHLEQSIREMFSDIIEAGENILIQVEQNWGGRTFYVDLQNRQIEDKSVVRVLRLQQVGYKYSATYVYWNDLNFVFNTHVKRHPNSASALSNKKSEVVEIANSNSEVSDSTTGCHEH